MICRIDGEHGDGVVVVPVKPASRGHPCHGFTAGVSGDRSQVIPSANSRRHPPRGACPPSSCAQRRWEGRYVPARRRSAAAIPAHEADLQRDPPAGPDNPRSSRGCAGLLRGSPPRRPPNNRYRASVSSGSARPHTDAGAVRDVVQIEHHVPVRRRADSCTGDEGRILIKASW